MSLKTKEEAPAVVEPSQGHTVYQENQTLPELTDQPPSVHPREIISWAKEKIGFDPDPYQIDLMTSASKAVLMLGGRQTGKSTAAAVGAIYEAIHHPNAPFRSPVPLAANRVKPWSLGVPLPVSSLLMKPPSPPASESKP